MTLTTDQKVDILFRIAKIQAKFNTYTLSPNDRATMGAEMVSLQNTILISDDTPTVQDLDARLKKLEQSAEGFVPEQTPNQ